MRGGRSPLVPPLDVVGQLCVRLFVHVVLTSVRSQGNRLKHIQLHVHVHHVWICTYTVSNNYFELEEVMPFACGGVLSDRPHVGTRKLLTDNIYNSLHTSTCSPLVPVFQRATLEFYVI